MRRPHKQTEIAGEIVSTAEKIYHEVKRLPEPLAREVLDFIEYIELKHGLRDSQIGELTTAQEPVMKKIWDNQQDVIWNDV